MADVSVQLGNKDAQWFIDHATDVTLLDGQHVYLDDNSGDFKKGDGSTLLGALPWITNTPPSIDGGSSSASGTTQQLKRDTSANWTSNNPTLLSGEQGLETDTGRIKIGTGATWSNTVYYLAPRVTSSTTATTLTVSCDTTDEAEVTALDSNLTIDAPTGTPYDGKILLYLIKDNGTSRTITLNSAFVDLFGSMFTSTTVNKASSFLARWKASRSKWEILASGTES